MKLEAFFEKFDQFAAAPDAMAKMRELVLGFAVQGKLVPQSANDEPADKLLNRIRAEKDELIDAGQMKRQRSNSAEDDSDGGSAVPPGWVLTTLGEVAQKITDGTHKTPVYVADGVPFISVKDFSGGRLDFSSTRFISPDEHAQLYRRCDPRRGDILLGRIGTLGKAVLVDTDIEFSLFVSVALIRFSHRFIEPAFFRLLLNSPHANLEFDRIKIGGATHTNKLNLGDLHTVSVPLPPLAEQKRIVAKVDELLAWCDRLAAQQQERERRHTVLARASVARFCDAPTPANLHFLFHPSYDILPADLRKSILTLAVQGKLVPQDPNDEPAAALLERIAAHKALLAEEGTLRGSPLVAPIADDEAEFELPASWCWVRFGDIARHNAGKTLDKGRNSGELRDYITTSNLYWGFFRLDEVRQMPIQDDELERCTAMKGDLLICEGGEAGRAAVWPHDYSIAFQNHVHRARFYADVDPYFVQRVFEKLNATGEIEMFRKGVGISNMSGRALAGIAVPLPPLAEQKRIVAKVDELVALCDRLAAQLAAARTAGADLMEVVVDELTARA